MPLSRGTDFNNVNAPSAVFRNPAEKPGSGKSGKPPPQVFGLVHLWSPTTDRRLTARHAELPQVVQERAGGWEQRPRPGRVPRATRPGSGQLLKIRLVLLIDGYGTPSRSIVDDLDELRLMGYESEKGPTRIVVVGSVPYASGGVRKGSEKTPPDWVIDNLSITEELHTPGGESGVFGVPCRAVATVDLLEYVEGDVEVRRLKSTKATKKPWRKGDTVSAFAKRHLGSSASSDLIKQANPKLNKQGWSKVKAGTLVVVPGVSSRLG